MPLLQPFLLLLLLAQSGFCLTRQNANNRQCSERHLQIFSNLSRSDSYNLVVKEKFTSAAAFSKDYYLTDKAKMVEYQIELFGIKPITTASIQANLDGCEQPVGWFDQLDPQWNITNCVLDKNVFLQVVTNPQRKITIIWTTSLSCDTTFRYRVDNNWEMLNTTPYKRLARSATSRPLEPPPSLEPYILLANERFIHQLSLDGSRLRTIISEPNQAIFTLDYHIRLESLFWIDTASEKVMQSNLDGSQPTTILDQQSPHSCISGIAVDWVSDKLYYHDRCHDHIRVLDLATNLHKTLTNDTAVYPYSQYYIDIVVDPKTRWLYWNSNRGIEKMSMDGKNRTVIINLNRRRYYVNTILSLTLDNQAQVLYWVFSGSDNHTLIIQSSNVDGTNQQTILVLRNNTVDYRHSLRFPPRLTIYNETLFLSSPWSNEIYKLRANGENFMTFISNLVLCRSNYHLKVTNQPIVPNPCGTINGGCSHFCLLSAVDPRGYFCDCPDGMTLDDGLSNCTFQNEISILSPSVSLLGSCVDNEHSSCCNNACQDNSTTCYCDDICHNSGIEDCCSDVPLDCEQVPNPCLTTNGGCSHFCLLSIVDPRGYSCDCPKAMVLGDDSHSCTFQNDRAMTFPLSPYGSCLASGYSSCCVNGSCQGNSSSCYCDANCHLFKDCCSDVPSDCEEKDFTEYIMIINQNHIHRIDINETKSGYRLQTPVSGLKNATSMDYHYRNNHLFWTDVLNDSVFIWRGNLDDGSGAIPLIDTGASPTQFVDIAVDWMSDKVYWTNINRIMVYDLQQGYQTTVINSTESYSLFYQVVVDPNKRILYWSDLGSNPPRIKNASMDGSGARTVVSLYSANDDYTSTFLFTIDYSQQMLYWLNGSNSCYDTNYIETSSIDGSGRRGIYNVSTMDGSCTNSSYPQAIDFFGGAIYTYSRSHGNIFKAVVENTPKIVAYNNVNWYMCNSTHYTVMKVISPERQLQGVNPCAVNNGGCAHLCLLSVKNPRNYICACHNGTRLHQDGYNCIGDKIAITQATQGSCSAAGFDGCCMTEPCKGEPPNCYCDSSCHTFKDCCPDANTLCKIKNITIGKTMLNFTTRPHNLSVDQSNRVEFQCSVQSTLIPTFAWNFIRKGFTEAEAIANGSGPLSTDYFIISRQRSQVLIITNVQWRHEGVYECIVSSDSHQIQAGASLNVSVPLTQSNLKVNGSSSTPERLDTVTIECTVTANPPANFIWTKRTSEGAQAIINTPRTSITHQLTVTLNGPTTRSTLTISNVEVADNGDYICEASIRNYTLSPSVSSNFTLCVIAPGSVTVIPHNHWVNQSGRAELTCSVCPTLMPLFMWNFTRRGEHDMEIVANRSQSQYYGVTVGQRSQTLIIGNAQWKHTGVYKCIASIGDTLIEAETSLNVLIPLTNLTIRGDNDNPRELDTVTIECSVTASPPANITWLKRTSERVRTLTSNSKTFVTQQLINTLNGPFSRSTLTVTNVEENDDGDYICEARNNQSSSESANFNFTVMTQNECMIDSLGSSPCQNHGLCVDHINSYTCHCNGSYTGVNCSVEVPSNRIKAPKISQPPENTVTRLGDPIHLNCTAEGHPAPTYEWYKDGVLIPNKIESVLYIPEPSPEDRGNYTCKAINSEGETDESNPAKLDIADVVQYQAKLNISEVGVGMELDQIMESITTTVFPNSSASVFEVKLLSVNTSSEEATILITIHRHAINIELSAIHKQLRSALLQILQTQTVIISRFDGCNYTVTTDSTDPLINMIEWPETNLGDTASVPCPCAEFVGSLAGRAYRYCSGTFSQGAHWEAFDISSCEALNLISTRRLCLAALLLAQDPEEAIKVAVEETSTPEELTAAQISVSITIVANLTDKVLNNSEVRHNYLQAIDNIQQAPADVVLKSQAQTSSSSRLLESLQTFLDEVEVEPDENDTVNSNQTVFAFETFALQVLELDPEEYEGQIFSVNLGSLEEAREDNQTIELEALMTSELESTTKFNTHEHNKTGNVNAMSDTTASLQLPEDLLDLCSDINSNLTSAIPQRLSYSVFKSDILFQSLNQSHLRIGSIIIAARLKCADNVTLNTSIKSIFQIDRMMKERSIASACVMWDKGDSEDRFGAWSTEGCREVVREGNRRVCECSQLTHFGILFDLSPKAPISAEAALALSIITYVGLVISLLCLMIFLISYLSAKKLRTSIHGQILINLSLALMGIYIFFLIGGHVTFIPVLCGISSALLHYFLLVFFGWTAVEAVWLYLKLVKVFGIQSVTSKFILKAGIPTWVVPLVVVTVCAGAASKYYINSFYCRATEWPFWIGMILPISLVIVFNWIMFVLIIVSICNHTQSPVADKKEGFKIKAMQTNFTIAATLAVVFGLGWGLGLAATSLPVKELTLTFQILFSVFVGAQGILLFLLHGVRNQDIRKVWVQCFAAIGRKSRLGSAISSTKTSSAGPESLRAARNTSGVSTLPRTKDEYLSAIDNTYSKQPYQSSVGDSIAMEMVPYAAGKGDWGQSKGGLQQVSFIDSYEEHIYDDTCDEEHIYDDTL